MAVQAGLGFSSGVPLLLTGQFISLWLSDLKLSGTIIGVFLSVGLAYTFKFAWAWVFDAFPLPFLGRRRGWILVFQLLLTVAILGLSQVDPRQNLYPLAVMAFVVATLSASQDVVVDALRADLLPPEQRAGGAAVYMLGYRAAMTVVGSGGLIVAQFWSWEVAYLIAAGLMLACVTFTFLSEEPEGPSRAPTIDEAVIVPFTDLFRRFDWRGALVVLLFAATYKFGEQMADGFTSVFYTKGVEKAPGLGFSKVDLATFTKVVGFAALAVGGAVAGWLTPRFGMRKALLVFGIVQATTNFAYVGLAFVGKSYALLALAIALDYLANTLGTVVFMAFFASVTNKRVSAMQMALLTSLSSVGKRVFGFWGGQIIDASGWATFFGATALMAIPGLVLVYFLPKRLFERPATSE